MASLRAAVTFADVGFSLNRYPAAVGSYAAHASHIATERWNKLRACTGGLGRERRIASRTASSQRRGLLPRSRDREARADHDHAGEQRGTEDADPTRSLHLWPRLAHGRRHSVSATRRPRMRGRVAAPHGREPIRADMEP